MQNTHKAKPLKKTTDFSKTPTSLISDTPHFSCGFTELLCATNNPDKHPPSLLQIPTTRSYTKGAVACPVFPLTGAMDDI